MEDYGEWIWDESEYNFFMSLSDSDKLEYVFDFFNFTDEEYDVDVFEFEPELNETSTNNNVDIVITNNHLVISCISDSIMDKTISMLRVDGMILILQEVRKNTRIYQYLGNSIPTSLN